MKYYEIVSIYKLREDLQDILITNDIIPELSFERLEHVSRNLFGAYRRNLYIIEPECYYHIIFKGIDSDVKNYFDVDHLLKWGLFTSIDYDAKIIYCFNPTQNQIFIQADTIFSFEEV